MNYKITVVEHGVFKDNPMSATFQGYHNQGVEDLPANLTIVQGGGKNILFDTGWRDKEWIEKMNADWVISPQQYLEPLGLKCEDIDMIIISHMHYDHVGNVDLFPNATVYISETEFEFWKMAIGLPEKYKWAMCFLEPRHYEAVLKIQKEGRLVLTKDGQEIMEGLTVYATPGHSPGSQCLKIDTPDGTYVLAGDAAYTQKNIDDMIPMGYGTTMFEQLTSFDKMSKMVGGNTKRIVPGHDLRWPDLWDTTKTFIEGMPNRITVVR